MLGSRIAPAPQLRDPHDVAPHVVYISNGPWLGGAEEFMVSLATTTRKAGWRVSAILPDRPYLASVVERLRAAGIKTYPTKIKTERDYLIPALLHLADLPQLLFLRRLLTTLAPDVVHINQPIAESAQLALQAAATLRGVSLVTTVHQYRSVVARGHRLGHLRDVVINWHYPFVQAISLPAASAARVLEEQYPHTAGKTCVIPPAINMDAFNLERAGELGGAERSRLGATGELLVGVVARLSKEKGQRALLSAWPAIQQQVPRARLILAGDGPDRPTIEALCQELDIQHSVTLLGHVQAEDVPALLSALDVVVVPSERECLPLAMLEAMAMGRPVVATAVDDIPTVLTHERSGLLVPSGDSAALASAVVRLLSDPGLMQALGQHARRMVEEHFTSAVQTSKLLDLYERVLLQRRGAAW